VGFLVEEVVKVEAWERKKINKREEGKGRETKEIEKPENTRNK